MKVLAPVPEFIGFKKSDGSTLDPGVYAAVIGLLDISQDEQGTWRLPFYYDPGTALKDAKVIVRIGV